MSKLRIIGEELSINPELSLLILEQIYLNSVININTKSDVLKNFMPSYRLSVNKPINNIKHIANPKR